MKTSEKMKTLTSKLLTFAFALLFAGGCASMTDANADLPQDNEITFETTSTEGTFWDSKSSDDMDPIIDRPQTGGTLD